MTTRFARIIIKSCEVDIKNRRLRWVCVGIKLDDMYFCLYISSFFFVKIDAAPYSDYRKSLSLPALKASVFSERATKSSISVGKKRPKVVCIICSTNWNLFNPPFRSYFTEFYGFACGIIKHNFYIIIISCHKLNHKFSTSTTRSTVRTIR